MAKKKKVAKKKASKKKVVRKTNKKAAKKKTFKPPAYCLNKREMAASAGVSVPAFDRWGVEPKAQKHKFGEAYFSVQDVIANRVANEVEKAVAKERRRWEKYIPEGQDDTEVNIAAVMVKKEVADLRWTEERGEGQALKNALMRRELAPVQMVSWVLGRIGAQISAVLDPLPSKIKHRLPALKTAEIHIMKAEIAKAKNLAAEASIDWDEFDFEFGAEPNGD